MVLEAKACRATVTTSGVYHAGHGRGPLCEGWLCLVIESQAIMDGRAFVWTPGACRSLAARHTDHGSEMSRFAHGRIVARTPGVDERSTWKGPIEEVERKAEQSEHSRLR